MKGIESVVKGYADGGAVNPFQDYAGGPQSFNPFAALSYLSAQGRPDFAIRPPATIATPVAQTGGGYRDIYGNLEAIKEALALKKALAAASKVVPEAPGGVGEPGGGAGGESTEAPPASSGYNPPAISGYDTLGKIAGVAGLATGLPLGPAATALSTLAAQDALRSYGIKDELSLRDSLLSGLSFGLLGKSIDKQTMDILNKPENLTMYNEALLGMQGQKGLADQATREITLDRALAALAAEEALGGETPSTTGFGGAGGRASGASPTLGGVSDVDIEAAMSTTTAPAPATTEVATDVMSGTEAPADTTTPDTTSPDASGDHGDFALGGTVNPLRRARGGYVPGKSGGMDDDVPAIIDGKEPARLSSGEFVFDAATVAALGDGNNQAGAKKLNQLREAIRQKAYGHKKQPPKNYSVGDLVRIYDRVASKR